MGKPVFFVAAVCFVALLTQLAAAPARAANELKTPLEVTYTVSLDGSDIGSYTMKVESVRNVYTITSILEPRGIVQLIAGGPLEQLSRFLIRKGRVVPLLYRERREGADPPEWMIRFDWTSMKIELPDGEVIDIPRQPVDAATASMQVMMTPPAEDRQLRVHIVSDKGVRRHHFSHEGVLDLETELGTLNALHVRQRKAGDDENNFVDIWLAPERAWVPVKIVRNRKGRRIEFTITALDTGDD